MECKVQALKSPSNLPLMLKVFMHHSNQCCSYKLKVQNVVEVDGLNMAIKGRIMQLFSTG